MTVLSQTPRNHPLNAKPHRRTPEKHLIYYNPPDTTYPVFSAIRSPLSVKFPARGWTQ